MFFMSQKFAATYGIKNSIPYIIKKLMVLITWCILSVAMSLVSWSSLFQENVTQKIEAENQFHILVAKINGQQLHTCSYL